MPDAPTSKDMAPVVNSNSNNADDVIKPESSKPASGVADGKPEPEPEQKKKCAEISPEIGESVMGKKDEPKSEETLKTEDETSENAQSDDANENRDLLCKEDSDSIFNLKDHEKKALMQFRSKLEEAILSNKFLLDAKKNQEQSQESENPEQIQENKPDNPKSNKDEEAKEEKEESYKEKTDEQVSINDSHNESSATNQGKEEEKIPENGEETRNKKSDYQEKAKEENKGEEDKKTEKIQQLSVEDISLWGVPLLPSKGETSTDTILVKFLKARDFEVNDAFEMLRNALLWRKKNNIDSIMEEDLGKDYDSVAYLSGRDREGHPVCYNVYGVFGDDEEYSKMMGTEETRERFLRWRLQLMEKEIQMLDFQPGGVSSLIQINDLKNSPGPSRKDVRLATKQVVSLLQDNYPEFVSTNIFINVPFWYYAFNALYSPFLTQRTKSKFVFTRPARVTETLLKYIAPEQIPVHYGGLKRENDSEFCSEVVVNEVVIKAGLTETIELPAPESGTTLVWDLTVVGWEVNYKEEFVPDDEGSYTVIVKKGRRMGWQEAPLRNSFRNNEPGKLSIVIENGMFKKKRVLYRYKAATTTATATSSSISSSS